MSQPNQHKNATITAAKASTNAKLQEAVQSPVPSTARIRNLLNAELQQRLNRKSEVEAVLLAFKSELEDENLSILALNKALDALAEEAATRPNLELVLTDVAGATP